MKRILLSILASALLLTTMVSCAAPFIDPDAKGTAILGTQEDKKGNTTVTILPGGSEYSEVSLLKQPKAEELTTGSSNYEKTTGHTIDISGYFPTLEEIVAKGRSEIPVYGIYAWYEDYATHYEEMQKIGFTNIRSTLARFAATDALSGAVTYYDDRFKLIANDDIEVLVTTGPGTAPFRYPDAQKDANGKYDSKDYDVEAWIQCEINTILNFLRRYGPNGTFWNDYPDVKYHPITCIELYNEPNFGYMVPDATDATKREFYARMQIATYAAIKAEYPDVRILGFGAGGANYADLGFINATFNEYPETAHTLDVVTTHPYKEDTSPFAANTSAMSLAKQLATLRSYMKNAGADVPLWYTECGYMISTGEGGHWNVGGGTDQLTQAAMLAQHYVFGMRTGIERITYMYMMDTDNCNYGVVNRDGSRRIAAYALDTMIEILPNPLITKAIFEGKDKYGTVNGVFAYEVEPEPGAKPVTIVFTVARPTEVSIPWSEPYAVVTDMVGTSVLVEAKNGALTLDAGACMLYVRSVDQVPNLDRVLAKPAPGVIIEDGTAAHAWDDKRYV